LPIVSRPGVVWNVIAVVTNFLSVATYVASTAWSAAPFAASDQLDVQLPNRMKPLLRLITALDMAPVSSATAIVQPPPSSDPPTRRRPA
jgi:hypothetical protein